MPLPRDPADWVAFNFLPNLGPIRQRQLLALHRDPARIAYDLDPETVGRVPGAPRSLAAAIRRDRRGLARRVERELERCHNLGIDVVPCDSPDYPAAFEFLPDAPILVYRRGTLPGALLRVAVVGSRSPTGYGRQLASGIAAGLAGRGVEVVSGGALGVDSRAHTGALDQDGRTVALLGSGLGEPYPAENRGLFERIVESGALISEFSLDYPIAPGNFPRRNRLISALSSAVVVVEAAERSGSLITARHAADQGREVLAVPGPVTSLKSVGCHRLIQQGAKLVQNIEDIFEELSPIFRLAARPAAAVASGPRLEDLSKDERAVLGFLDPVEHRHLDNLADRVLFGMGRLQAALFGLEARGAVEQTPGGYYVLRPSVAGHEPESNVAEPQES